MNEQELKASLTNIRMWARGDQRAPHKPLLILYALGRILRGESRMVQYGEARENLKILLSEFGPPRTTSPIYPFYHLQSDGIWQLNSKDFSLSELRPTEGVFISREISGGFTREVYSLLRQNPTIVRDVARNLLEQNFPETLHDDILSMVGITLDNQSQTNRDPRFRERILKAYGYSCAICGFDVRIGQNLLAIEAAHIKWHQAGGPDTEGNGVALCIMHHKLYDKGAFSINRSLLIEVAEEANGTCGLEEWLMRYHGKPVRSPIRPDYSPKDTYLDWHLREVFRGPGRYLTG